MRSVALRIAFLLAALLVLAPLPGQAQNAAFLQIEAVPTLRAAETRARAYANAFPNVNAFRMVSGWYAIALGPYPVALAREELLALRRERLIPADSYLARASDYRSQVWPAGADALSSPTRQTPLAEAAAPAAVPEPEPEAAPEVAALPAAPLEETPREARQNEALLTEAERKAVQEALQWEGFYAAGIDGAFGSGTRRAMRDWQTANGHEPTGILTTRQRRALLDAYRAVFAPYGLSSVSDDDAGIEIVLPLGKVEYARTEAPFVQYDPVGDSGMRVLLISQSGDEATLFGLYDIMQTLEIVPPEGERQRRSRNFVIEGESAALRSYTEARLEGGAIKGFSLVWEPGKDDPRVLARVLETMKTSFRSLRGAILPDTAMSGDGSDQRIDLLAGLEIRRPESTRTGFFVDAGGRVLTTVDAVAACRRVTLGGGAEAEVAARDAGLGLALLRPRQDLAPIAVAAFQDRVPRLKSEVAVAGFPYGDAMELPVLTFGTLADIRGLAGETDRQRLDLAALEGDAGGPVLDQTGAVVGLLRPRAQDGARRLPDEVSFATGSEAIRAFLEAQGVQATMAGRRTALAPEDIASLAADIAVRVNCWN